MKTKVYTTFFFIMTSIIYVFASEKIGGEILFVNSKTSIDEIQSLNEVNESEEKFSPLHCFITLDNENDVAAFKSYLPDDTNINIGKHEVYIKQSLYMKIVYENSLPIEFIPPEGIYSFDKLEDDFKEKSTKGSCGSRVEGDAHYDSGSDADDNDGSCGCISSSFVVLGGDGASNGYASYSWFPPSNSNRIESSCQVATDENYGTLLIQWWDYNNNAFTTVRTLDNSDYSKNQCYTRGVYTISDLPRWVGDGWFAVNYNSDDGWYIDYTDVSWETPVPNSPSLSSPSNGATCVSYNPTNFDWGNVSGATSYEIYISGNTYTVSSSSYSKTLNQNTTYTWKVRAQNDCGGWGSWSSTRSFTTTGTPGTPSLSSPSNGATCVSYNPTYFDWGNVSGAIQYEINISGNTYTTTSSSYNRNLSQNTTYTWKVRAKNSCNVWGSWSSTRSFTTTGTPGIPSLSTPSSNATCVSYNPTNFDWSSVSGATQYEIYISPGGTYTTSSSNYSRTLNPNTMHTWKVRAKNSCNVWGSWSSTRSFTTTWTPGTPSLISPPNNATCVTNPVTISWSSVSGATQYEVNVSPGGTYLTSSTSYSANLNPNITYCWKVRAKNNCNVWGNWSNIWCFTTAGTPGTPSLVLPSNNDADVEYNPANFDWNDVSGASQYEVNISPGATYTTSSSEYSKVLNPNTPYTWKVRAKNNCNIWGNWSSTWSFTTFNPVGSISGNVSTPSGNAVEGVLITVTPGNYTDSTDSQGNYSVKNIDYSSNTMFYVTPSKDEHIFYPETTPVPLNSQTPDQFNVNFEDRTYFSICGEIKYLNTDCPVSGVEIKVDGNPTEPPTFTNASGGFCLEVIIGSHIITPSLSGHTFDPENYQDYIDAPVSGLLFEDELTYSLSGKVVGGCDYSIGQAEITITSTPSCYSPDPITTNPDNGTYTKDLPPLVYYVDAGILGNPLIEFETQTVDLTQGNQSVDFIHHNPIEIEFSGFPDLQGSCQVPVLQQGESYEIEISVFERYGENICPLESGELTVYDHIGDIDGPIVVQLDNGTASYTIIAGEPNILSGGDHPYQKQFEVYINPNGETVSQDQWVYAEGHKPRDATFTTVSPELPLIILRDPPGDESYSYLSTLTSLCYSNSVGFELEAGVELFSTAKIGAEIPGVGGISGSIGTSIEVGGGAIGHEEVEVCISSQTIFKTSDNEEITGPEGDVFGGAAINLIYAITDVLEVDDNCNVSISQNIAWEGSGFLTHYLFTQGYIRDVLIPGLLDSSLTDPDSISLIESADLWQSILDLNDQLKAEANQIINETFSAGAQTEYEESVTITETKYVEFYMYIDTEVAAQAGVEVFGSGGEAGVKVKARFYMGASQEITYSQTNTVGYSLRDNDPGDSFTLDIKGDQVYGTLVFDLLSGASSCPWEHPTQPREGVQLSIDPNEQNDVPLDNPAVFTLYLGNTSQTNENREYCLAPVQESNSGVSIEVNGQSIENCMPFTIPYNQQIQATMTVERVGLAYDYDSLQIELFSQCDHDQIADTAIFSIHWPPPCSEVSIFSPEDNWVINQSNNDTLQVIITDYDLTNENLLHIELQYSILDENNWIMDCSVDIGDLPQEYLPCIWDVSNLDDGEYEIRAVAVCSAGEKYSSALSGIIDRTSPELISKQPADGILSPGDEISFTFNEFIDGNSVTMQCCSLVYDIDGTPINTQLSYYENKIFITPDIDYYYIENHTLRSVASCVTDQNGNELAEPISWSFYVDLGPLHWNPVSISGTSYVGEKDTLYSQLENSFAQIVHFTISGNKEWITPDPVSNDLQISGFETINFVVKELLDVGEHKDTIYAETLDWPPEPIYVTVNKICAPPDWSVTPADYEYSMTITAQLYFEDVLSTDVYDRVGAFVDDECRGIAPVDYVEGLYNYIVFLTVHSNNATGDETIKLKAWNASECLEFCIEENFTFIPDGSIGTPINPIPLHATSCEIVQVIPLNQGWTWFSLCVNPEDSGINTVLDTLTPATGDLIKGQTSYAQYVEDKGWLGPLQTIDCFVTYLIKLTNADTLIVEGALCDCCTPIPIVSGWNWIGYPLCCEELGLNDALSSLESTTGDLIKSQVEYAQYVEGVGWIGSLTIMEPGEGYMLKSANPGELIFCESEKLLVQSNKYEYSEPASNTLEWSVDVSKYEYNMTVTGKINFNGEESNDINDVIAAFVGNECRGIAQPIYVPYTDEYEVFLMIYSNMEESEQVNFWFYDASDSLQRRISGKLSFLANEAIGNVEEPYQFVTVPLGISDAEYVPDEYSLSQNFPNPFNPTTTIGYGLPEDSYLKLIIYDILGKKIQTLVSEFQAAGYRFVTWDARDYRGQLVPTGVYFYKLEANNYFKIRKMILLK